MASTNKTANLGLNQWVLSDPFLMEDMNADNRKIDAAIGETVMVKLLDVTTSANAAQVDLDVSGIDLTKYAAIRLVAAVKVTPLGTATSLMLKINNGTTFTRHRNENDLYSRNYAGYIFVNTMDDYFSNFDMDLSGIPDNISSAYYPQFVIHGFDHYGGNTNFHAWSFDGVVPLEANTKISSINFVADSGSVSIKAGSKFKIYGVRK